MLSIPDRTPTSTPAPPDDAPPSVKATSAARRELRKKTKGRLFPTVEYTHRLSYFDPNSDYSNFRGFFVLFWIGLAIMVITSMLRNLRETGHMLNFKQWPLFTENIWELAASDLLMAATTGVNIPLNLMYKNSRGWLRWNRGGIVVQSVVQAIWLYVWIAWPFARDWTWTAQVFFTLHTLALFMKMHSYAFYCGHLATTYQRLKELDLPIGPQTPVTAAVRYPHTFPEPDPFQLDGAADKDEEPDDDQPPIIQLRNDLAKELTSPAGNVTYPTNLTVANFSDYLLCPTLCYELEYPRTESRSYIELFYKTLAVFGCIFLMTVTSEEFILPVLDESHLRLQQAPTLLDSALIFAETVSRLLFPFMVTFLLVFLVIFEYVLGAFAEITCFADRQFYSDWWNSLDWLEFSREWNIPVHNFFRRHVYSASRGVKLSRPVATGITFFISALAHELVMGCITRKFRGYGFVLMMLQMPFVMVQRLPWVRKRKLLNNVMFWICMIIGLSLVSLCSSATGMEDVLTRSDSFVLSMFSCRTMIDLDYDTPTFPTLPNHAGSFQLSNTPRVLEQRSPSSLLCSQRTPRTMGWFER
jgi:sterol O-acyltransferase